MPGLPTVDLASLRSRHPQHFQRMDGRRRATIATAAGMVALLVFALAQLGFFDGRLIDGMGRLAGMVAMMLPPLPRDMSQVRLLSSALLETVAISLLGTLGAALLAFPLAFLAARNITAQRIVRFLSRRSLDTIRSVDILVWALIWVNVVGLGPFAGALAIMTADIGTFGKLFSEAIEAADRRPVEGIVSTGGGRLLGVRFGIIPEVFPVLASQVLYFFESNTRSASIIGIVGAGGIGLHLAEAIRTLELQQTSFIILMILITVAIIDFVSSRLRFAVIGRRGGAA
ncbi:phosphonate ABC transporter, permease protein PhnE [Reyranella sp.]|uniref:phosphonate ABC transporter, permease protein PhnE n=1 Tax=Reyranella sp. TaxID=1929291 RepID=UPI003BAD6EC5